MLFGFQPLLSGLQPEWWFRGSHDDKDFKCTRHRFSFYVELLPSLTVSASRPTTGWFDSPRTQNWLFKYWLQWTCQVSLSIVYNFEYIFYYIIFSWIFAFQSENFQSHTAKKTFWDWTGTHWGRVLSDFQLETWKCLNVSGRSSLTYY